MKQFVAMTDEMLYRSDGPPGPLVPYQCGVFCWHQLREDARAWVSGAPATAASASDERAKLSA
jgi:hypothetical protein